MNLNEVWSYLKERNFSIDEKNRERLSDLFGNSKNQIENLSVSYEELMRRLREENDKEFFRRRKGQKNIANQFIIRAGEIEDINKFYSKDSIIICFKNDKKDERSWDIYFYDPTFK